eukprot:Nk52_evm6s366 gene=Nk52_evmTU6s366
MVAGGLTGVVWRRLLLAGVPGLVPRRVVQAGCSSRRGWSSSRWLSPVHESLLERERVLVGRVVGGMEERGRGGDEGEAVYGALRRVERGDLFMLVCVGEFNSGKSTVTNALLGGDYVETGILPTTKEINVISGVHREGKEGEEEVRRLFVDSPLLRHANLIDTPGTNALNRMHEQLTEHFLPQCDLILFVTSAERPLPESERQFLEKITGWGKKLIVVVNKIDLLGGDKNGEEAVLGYVREGLKSISESTAPPVFGVSALRAVQHRGGGGGGDDRGFVELERHIRGVLTGVEYFRIKLSSPLGAVHRALVQCEKRVDAQKKEYTRVLEEMDMLERRLDVIVKGEGGEKEKGEEGFRQHVSLAVGQVRDCGYRVETMVGEFAIEGRVPVVLWPLTALAMCPSTPAVLGGGSQEVDEVWEKSDGLGVAALEKAGGNEEEEKSEDGGKKGEKKRHQGDSDSWRRVEEVERHAGGCPDKKSKYSQSTYRRSHRISPPVAREEGSLAALGSGPYLTQAMGGERGGLDTLPTRLHQSGIRLVDWVDDMCRMQWTTVYETCSPALLQDIERFHKDKTHPVGLRNSEDDWNTKTEARGSGKEMPGIGGFGGNRASHQAALLGDLEKALCLPPLSVAPERRRESLPRLVYSTGTLAGRISGTFQQYIASAAVLQGGMFAVTMLSFAICPEYAPGVFVCSGAGAIVGSGWLVLQKGVKEDIVEGIVQRDTGIVAEQCRTTMQEFARTHLRKTRGEIQAYLQPYRSHLMEWVTRLEKEEAEYALLEKETHQLRKDIEALR